METPPLAALFVDCDSFFASVEQHLDPALRGRAVGVAAVMAESTCCIAASQEAKRFGVKTGTKVSDARKLCRGIAIVEAKPGIYVEVHRKIIEAVNHCIPVEEVLSIDEMWARLPLNWREPAWVEELGLRIKAEVAAEIGPSIKVSIGAAPNRWLAKMASKMRKPDGLLVIRAEDLPDILYDLDLRDLHGVSWNMEARLHAAGIHSVAELCAAPQALLHRVWGGIGGDRMWHTLRGMEIPEGPASEKKSISHSHVLPPDRRRPDQAWPVLCKLLHKACERLRSHALLASAITLQLRFCGGRAIGMEVPVPETDVTSRLIRAMGRLWRERPDPEKSLLKVGVVLQGLRGHGNYTPLLPGLDPDVSPATADEERSRRLDATVDALRVRFGRQAIFLGSVQPVRDAAPMRIAFNHIPDVGLEGDA